MKLLHIIAAPRGAASRTLQVSNTLLDSLKEKNPALQVDDLDLFKIDLPEVYGGAVDAKYTLLGGGALDDRTKMHWDKIMEFAQSFMSYDLFLISSPMWNFTIPYKLKQYIDVIMQAGVLFNYGQEGITGLAAGKKMYCVTSRGSDYSKGSPYQQFDFLEPYIRAIFGFAGLTNISFVNAQPLDFDPTQTDAMVEKAKQEAVVLIENGSNS